LSTKYAVGLDLPVVKVQHHHAHIASVLAEKKISGPVIGVSFDGLGWGDDGQAWGGEFLMCDNSSYKRAGHIEYLPLPGGDATTKRPYRMAYVYLRALSGDDTKDLADRLPPMSNTEMQVIDRMIAQQINTPLTSSAGRLFDAAASIIGICHENTYEAQAPIELEKACAENEDGFYDARIEDAGKDEPFVVRSTDLVRGLLEDSESSISIDVCAAKFHNSLARIIHDACEKLREKTQVSAVALSGGVFANTYLMKKTLNLMQADGFEVLLNSIVPAGDAGVSLGQAVIAGSWRSACA